MQDKMKPLALCLLLLLLTSFIGGRAEAADILTVKVSGTAMAGQEAKAIEEAKKRAVFKVFSHDTRAENDPNSVFVQMLERYNDYVESCKVTKKTTTGNQLLVIAEIAVRHSKLHDDFQELVAQRQMAQDDMTASIVMRAVNTTNNQGFGDGLEQAFNHRFGLQGFQVQQDEELVMAKQHILAGAYDDYVQGLQNLIDNNTIMTNFAIIGEVGIEKVMSNPTGKGYMAKSMVRIHAYDCMRKAVVGDFQESYEILADTEADAERLVLQKASIDAAEKMAKDTLRYWRNTN